MKKRFSGPQIVAKLRQADVFLGQGKTVPEVCKEIEISQHTDHHKLFILKFGNFIKKFNTFTVKTKSGGYHLYFNYDERFDKTNINPFCDDGEKLDIDIISNDGLVFSPRCTNYEICKNKSIQDIPESLADWLLSRIPTKKQPTKKQSPKQQPTKPETNMIKIPIAALKKARIDGPNLILAVSEALQLVLSDRKGLAIRDIESAICHR